MKLRTRTSIAAVAVASVIGGGVAGAVLTGPATALAQETEDESTTIADGVTTLEDVLSGLVSEGVITQEQADAVGEAIREARPMRGHRHSGGGFLRGASEDVAAIIGVTVDELGEALRSGSSLADVAAENGADAQEIIDLLVAEAQERLDTAVENGRLTEDEAAEKAAELETRITEMVNGELERGQRRGFVPRGPGAGSFGGDVADDAGFNA